MHDPAKAVMRQDATAKDGTYQPLSRPILIYVSTKPLHKPPVAKFVEFYMDPKNATKLVAEVGYVPLPEAALKAFRERVTKRMVGTGFTGSKIGVSVAELMKG